MRILVFLFVFVSSTSMAFNSPKEGTLLVGLGIELPIRLDSLQSVQQKCSLGATHPFPIETPSVLTIGTVDYYAAYAYCDLKANLEVVTFKNDVFNKIISLQFLGTRVQINDGPGNVLPIHIKNYY